MEDKTIKFDSGFYFGKGLFETILVLEKPIFLKEHLLRLNKGLKKLGINNCVEEKIFLDNIKGMKNCAVKLMVSEDNCIITKRETGYSVKDYEKGFSLSLSKLRKDVESHMVYLKSFNYMDNIVEREQALKAGFNEVIFLNNEGYITEGSVSNIFFIMEEHILTPNINCGLLDGIVRGVIIKEFGQKYNIIQDKIMLEDISECKGMFLTNSLMGIMWVNSFKKRIFEKHNIYDEIYRDYKKLLL